MNLCSVLFVDRQPLRTAPIRAYLRRYVVNSALSSAPPQAGAPQPPVIMQGDPAMAYRLWLIVVDDAADVAAWRTLPKPDNVHWAALRVAGSKVSVGDLNAAPFDHYFELPLSPQQIESLLRSQGGPLAAAPRDTYLEILPLLDDSSAQAAAMGDAELVTELRAMLRDDLRQRRQQVAQELSCNQIAEAAETVHRLVGGCAYCGAKAMQTASLEFENGLRQREVDKVDAAYGRWLLAAEQLLPALDNDTALDNNTV